MAKNKKTITFIALISIVMITTATSIKPDKKFKNLKILPKDISEKKLDSIMKAFTRALNVTCNFCHVPPKKDMFSLKKVTDTLDYSLDNEMKENARRMIRMTIDINKTYFNFDSIAKPEFLNVVNCNTCHRGNPYPANE